MTPQGFFRNESHWAPQGGLAEGVIRHSALPAGYAFG
jgi:hypothetical protein